MPIIYYFCHANIVPVVRKTLVYIYQSVRRELKCYKVVMAVLCYGKLKHRIPSGNIT